MASSPAEVAGSVRLRVLDTDLVVRVPDAAVEHDLRRLFAPFADPPAVFPGGPPVLLGGWAPPPGAAATVHELTAAVAPGGLSAVATEINALALAGAGCFAVHAGAVAAGGSVVAFPAASGAGKTTLTAACLAAGLAYVSDEALCLDWHDAAVRPYPRPLALSQWSATAVGVPVPDAAPAGAEVLITADDLGATLATRPLRLAHVVLLDRPGGPPGLRPATRSAGVAELLRRSFTHWHRPERAFELAHEALADATVWRLSPSTPPTDAAAVATLLHP